MSETNFYEKNKKLILGIIIVIIIIIISLLLYFLLPSKVTQSDINTAQQTTTDTSIASQQAAASVQQSVAAQQAAAAQSAAAASAAATATTAQQQANAAAAATSAAAATAEAKRQTDAAAAAAKAATAAAAKAAADQAQLIAQAQAQAAASTAAAEEAKRQAAAQQAAAQTQAQAVAAAKAAAEAKLQAELAAAQKATADEAARQAALQASQQATAAQKAAAQAAAQAYAQSQIFSKFTNSKCDVPGYDLISENIDGRNPAQLAERCFGLSNCNSFNIVGTKSYFKNVPDGKTCVEDPNITFYSMKHINFLSAATLAAADAAAAARKAAADAAAAAAAQAAQAAAQATAQSQIFSNFVNNKCDVPGYDILNEDVGGRTPEQIAARCYGLNNCNAFNIIGSTTYFKNIPDGASCLNNPNVNFYSMKNKNIKTVLPSVLDNYTVNKCDVNGFDLVSQDVGGRTPEQLATYCNNNLSGCNAFNIIGTKSYFKNIPDGASCLNDPNVNFYSMKNKNVIPSGGPKTYLNDYNYNKCEIDGSDVKIEPINGRTPEQIAKLCSETPNCNSFNWDGTTTYLKNVPDNAWCMNVQNGNFYSLKTKNIIPFQKW